MVRWVIYLDIEGFQKLYQGPHKLLAYNLLTGLVTDVWYIIEKIYPEPNLFRRDATFSFTAHQVGDTVIIAPGITGKDVLKIFIPVCISIALMRSTVMRGGFAKTAISYGDMADFKGCYPDEIREKFDESGLLINTQYVPITIVPVMGEGLIRAYDLSKKAKGPLLIIDPIFKSKVRNSGFDIIFENNDYFEVNWVHPKVNLVNEIITKIGLKVPSDEEIVEKIKSYLKTSKALPKGWRKNALRQTK